jgi:type IV/VI secretion system ImpK/VasF family protein
MKGVDESVKDSLLKKFYKFYQEVIQIKKSADFSQKENLKNVQTKLLELIEQYALNIQPFEKEEDDSTYRDALYLLSVYVDELFINIPWNGENIWEENLLEEQLFQTHNSGIRFYEMVENNLNKSSPDAGEMSILYLLFISLGFKGRFMFYDTAKKLNYYKKQLFISIFKTNPLILKEMKLLFPDAYAYNQTNVARARFYNVRIWSISILLSVFAAAFIFYLITEPKSLHIDINNLKYFIYVNQVYIFLALLVILLIIAVYFLITIYRKKELFQKIRKKITRFEISESLRLLSQALHDEFPNRSARNDLPLYLLLGIENSGTTTLLKNIKIKKIASSPFEEFSSIKSACNWCIFDQGAFIDPASKIDENIEKSRMWKYFIRKLKKVRRLRPLDGIIITVSYEELTVSGNIQFNGFPRIKTKVDLLFSKLLYVQKKLRMQLPVYILVTKCDKIAGFEELIKKLPDEFEKNIFGWSSPYNANVISYTKNWILEAFQSINSRLNYLLLGLCIEDSNEYDFDKIFNMKNEIDSLKYSIQILTNKIFGIGQNTLLAPLILRGIYFTGSRSSRPEDIEASEKVFTYDLIDKKIVRESALAKPVRKIIIY